MSASGHNIAERLLAWYDRHARTLPWRSPPGAAPPDPYRVWLSEIMLQQTTVAAVIPHFERFTRRWPDLRDLAAASDAEVMAAWAGLGYYSRARNLLKTARIVADADAFPRKEAELRALPGLGAYTAAAIAAIAFGERAVVVDANVERVVARLFAISEPLPTPRARLAIRQAADAITPHHRPGDFAQAMMDLGSTVCTPRAPKCLLCPLSADCAARLAGESERYPVKTAKKPVPERVGQAYWIERDGAVWLVRRPSAGLYGGMRALPGDGWTAARDGDGEPPISGGWQNVGAIVHGFTHARLTLTVRRHVGEERPEGEGEWWPLGRLEEAGLPTLFARAATLVLRIR